MIQIPLPCPALPSPKWIMLFYISCFWPFTKTTEEPPISTCLFITNVTKIWDENIERPWLKEPVFPSQIQREMGWKRGKSLERGSRGVVVGCFIRQDGTDIHCKVMVGPRVKSCFQRCTVQREILITLDWSFINSACWVCVGFVWIETRAAKRLWRLGIRKGCCI